MNEIVDRDTFLYYLDNADVDWEATARECIAKGFELAEENKKLKEKLEKIKHIMNVLNNVGYYKDLEKTVLQIIEGAENDKTM
jgi:hypothetical protein